MITLKLENEDQKIREICFSCIRCGVSWPIAGYPGYYCIFGLSNGAKAGEPGSLLLLGEGERELLAELIDAVIEEARCSGFSEIFTDVLSPEWHGMNASAGKMLRENGKRLHLLLRHAPFADDFHLGRDLIRKWGKNGALKIPEDSNLYKHMINPSSERIPEGKKYSFYSINALRYVVMAFEKIPFRRHKESVPHVSYASWI